jgi:hypothetical protein
VGKPFPLFPPQRTDITVPDRPETYPGIPRFSSHISLDSDGLVPPLPVEIAAIASWKSRTQAFTPFAPQLGYHLSLDDMDPARRREKVVAAGIAHGLDDIPGQPLVLGASIDDEAIKPLGILQPVPGHGFWRFTDDALPIVSALRFHVMFPNGLRLESRPEPDGLRYGSIVFKNGFYPFDTGPLAVPDGYAGGLMDEGLQIALPANPELVAQIEGRYIIRR